MRRLFRISFVVAAALAVILSTSCSDDASSTDLGPANDAGPPSVTTDAGSNGTDAEASTSAMRLAHLAPELGPIDFCYQAGLSGTFVGPVLGGPPVRSTDGGDGGAPPPDAGDAMDASTDASAPRSASYRTVSEYMDVLAGPLTLAIVSAGSGSCANALARADVTLDPGRLSTVALFGRRPDGGATDGAAHGDLEIAAFTDDRTTRREKARVRVIHAALGTSGISATGPLAVRAVASKTTILADRVEPRRAATASPPVEVDAFGYVTASPIPSPVSLAIGPASTDGGTTGFAPWQSPPLDLGLSGGSLHTAFVLSGAAADTFEVLWCTDLTTVAGQTMCQTVR